MNKEIATMICSTFRTTVLLSLGICLLTPCGLAAQDTTATTSRIQGTVFSGAPDEPLYRPGAKVTLYGDTGVISTITDQDGKFVFANIGPPEIYFIEASYMGLHAERNVMVEAGAVVQVSLHLKVPDPNMSKP
jgi:hypothetical protein